MTKKSIRNFYVSGAVIALVATASPALSQTAQVPSGTAQPETAETATQGDIIVTAQRKAENQQNVPVAITAFSQNTLQQKSIFNAFDLNKAVPGLNTVADSANSSLPTFSIRGRGQSYGAASGSVETYFADVPLSPPFQSPSLPPQFFDLQSVQVLKGPQGTLFGRNSTGGAVLFVPAPATTDKIEGYARIQGGTFDDFQFEGAVNLPFSDQVALRVAGFEWHRKGYARTIGGRVDDLGRTLPSQTINNQDVTEVRATLLLKPTDSLTNSTIFTYHTDQNRGSLQAQFYNSFGPGFTPVPATAINPALSARVFDNNVDLRRSPSSTWAIINTTTLDLGSNITLKNIASHIHAMGVTANPSDYDGTGAGPIASLQDGLGQPRQNRNYQTTDEIQLQGRAFDDRVNYIFGGLIDLTRQPGGRDNLNYFNLTFSAFNPPTAPFNENFIQSRFTSQSLFGSLTFNITDTLSITGGARHTWDSITQVSANILTPTVVTAVPASVPLQTDSIKFQGWTYNAGVEFRPTSATMLYGGYRHGYKRGGFNTQVGVPSQKAFLPETDDDFYIGIKQNLKILGVPGHINVEGFYDIYYGAQRYFLTFAASGLATVITNAEKSTYRGFDADIVIDPAKWLSLSGNYTFVDSKYNKFIDKSVLNPAAVATLVDPTTDLSKNPLGLISKHKLSFTARLHADLADGSEIAFSPTYSYQTKVYSDDYSARLPNSAALFFLGGQQLNLGQLGLDTIPSYSLVDLRLEWNKVAGSKFDLAVNANNLLNKTYPITVNTLYPFGVQAASYGPPRMFTFDVRFHW